MDRMANSRGPYFTDSGCLHNLRRCDQNQWVFEAQLEGSEVIVKFSRHPTVHRYLAELRLAPQLVHVEAR